MDLLPPKVLLALKIRMPYLRFPGDVGEAVLAKTTFDLLDRAPELFFGEYALSRAMVVIDFGRLKPEVAHYLGVRMLVIDIGSLGRGELASSLVPELLTALRAG